ncbi:MAG: sigma 54-interacting transcriptional regulator [Desulfovibrio sp.]|nr:sigma 54-interacting transcriptional regulator [Desulfovibrio sp.]MBI4960636.1 sigma 54-interacting transcriptional regulator [Desulfovibrio sp.]
MSTYGPNQFAPEQDSAITAVADGDDIRRQLHRSERKLTRLLNNLPGMAYCCRIGEEFSYVLEFVSRGSIDLLGFTPEELITQKVNTIERMMHPEDVERVRKEEREAILQGRPYKLMYRVTAANGETKWLWDQGEPVFEESGLPVLLEGIIMDVSVQKMREITLQEENERLRSSVNGGCGLGELVGMSLSMQQVYKLILKAAQSDTNVVIFGETGTGKDLVARTIHEMSGRKGKYVPVNCGAIPEQLLESEFFGHKKGAFSGAYDNRQGYLAAADGGTLFLDELGELNLNLQVKLLRAIETKQYVPVGDTVPRRSDFRIITATHKDIKEMVREKTMRADFFYRIHVLSIHIPALRERPEDIPLLIDKFLARCEERGQKTVSMSAAVRMAMMKYDWPGNIRELHNVLDRYVTFGEVNFSDVRLCNQLLPGCEVDIELRDTETLNDAVERLEKAMIQRTLEQCRWHKGETARVLGLNLRTLQRKVKQYGI